jgi:hypothetical protein
LSLIISHANFLTFPTKRPAGAGLPIPPAGVFALLAELGLPLDYEWVVKTGQGYHVWLRCENLALSVGRLDRSGCAWSQTEKIELRYRGHYAVLPPSLHPSGLIYRFVYGAFPVTPPAAVAAPRLLAVYDLLTTPSPQLVPTELSLSVPSGLSGYDKWITQAIERVEKLGKGRNDTGFWLACQLRDDSYNQKEALHVLEKFRQRVSSEANPYTRQEIEKSIHSAYRRAPRSKARSNLTPP